MLTRVPLMAVDGYLCSTLNALGSASVTRELTGLEDAPQPLHLLWWMAGAHLKTLCAIQTNKVPSSDCELHLPALMALE